jgi:hypothetical protein
MLSVNVFRQAREPVLVDMFAHSPAHYVVAPVSCAFAFVGTHVAIEIRRRDHTNCQTKRSNFSTSWLQALPCLLLRVLENLARSLPRRAATFPVIFKLARTV